MGKLGNKAIMLVLALRVPSFEDEVQDGAGWMEDVIKDLADKGENDYFHLYPEDVGLYSIHRNDKPYPKIGAIRYENGMFSSAWYSYWSRSHTRYKTKVVGMGDFGQVNHVGAKVDMNKLDPETWFGYATRWFRMRLYKNDLEKKRGYHG